MKTRDLVLYFIGLCTGSVVTSMIYVIMESRTK